MVKIKDLNIKDYYRVVEATCDKSDLYAIIAVHNINLGPALGGCRVLEYNDKEAQLKDALNLSKGMTYKSALAGNKLGGGKATINGPLTDEKLKAFGEAMNKINHNEVIYYTAADVGTNAEVLEKVAQISKFVNYKGQDCSIATAWGVYYAMLGALRYKGRFMDEQKVSILGHGKVGSRLSNIVRSRGGMAIVSDKYDIFDVNGYGKLEGLIPDRLGYVDHRTAHYKGTLFAPCALGGIINERTINDIPNDHIICGAANNQLSNQEMEIHMINKNITYVPDYLANAGGVIIVAEQNNEIVDLEWSDPRVLPRLAKIEDTTLEVLQRSDKELLSTVAIANKMAEEIIYG